MSIPNVPQTDTFDQWRIKTNTIAENVGDLDNLNTTDQSNIVAAVNENKEFTIAMAIALG